MVVTAIQSGKVSCVVLYKVRNCATVKFVTKASQWRKTTTRGRRRKSRGALNLRIVSFAGSSERQRALYCMATAQCKGLSSSCGGVNAALIPYERLPQIKTSVRISTDNC
ncbi:hypothetical protein EVAR_93244_1 [Eumeta japonica]|uniref:Uncharacterized protein n=1 Tax=Eumeta variegata TaxID=151549 RepID=A0A4C1TYY9_EUMVA|nr:hypothetical protein EVAR_93244_1 [Eumeta japonica]